MKSALLVSAGELSGDQHAADVIRIFKREEPDLQVFGLGGSGMRGAGVELIEHIDQLSVMGLGEVLRRYSFFTKLMKRTLAEVDRQQPRAALLIDYPGFNIRLAKELKQRGVRVYYYISPKFWAWNRRRIYALAEAVDEMLVIFPFEVPLLEKALLSTHYVGNPLVEQIRRVKAAPRVPVPWGEGKRVALLPGSRLQEVNRMWPLMRAAAFDLHQQQAVSCVVVAANERMAQRIRELGLPPLVRIVVGEALSVLEQADAAWVTSGTATLEAALIGIPHCLVYRTGALTYAFAKTVLNIKHVGLVNILAGREVTPELLQHNATPQKLVATLEPLLELGVAREKMLAEFEEVRQQLGSRVSSVEVVARVKRAYSEA
jgi:lipid-A-disaccharide synthase